MQCRAYFPSSLRLQGKSVARFLPLCKQNPFWLRKKGKTGITKTEISGKAARRMIFGIGCDLCTVERIEKSLSRAGSSFAQRVYGEGERAALGLSGTEFSTLSAHTVESAAADFAAKEAFLKAAGTGLPGFAMAEVEALRRESGAPYYAFSGKAAQWMRENRLTAQLSLSHENGMAMAFCILEKID
jgi:holo-[acyl-carrier protein] synthase